MIGEGRIPTPGPRARPVSRALRILLAPILALFLTTGTALGQPFELTEEEAAWLAEHPVLRLGPAPRFPPVEFFDDDGVVRGLAADYVALVEARLGVRFEPVRCASWDEVLARTRAGEIDAWAEAAATPERGAYMRFSRPDLTLPTVLITHSEQQGALSLEGMSGKKVVVVQGYATHDYLRERYPKVELITVPDIETGLRLVSFQGADAMVASLAAASYYVEVTGLSNLRVAGEAGYTWELSFATRKDQPLLASAVQKALDAISKEQHQELYRRWVGFKVQAWRPSAKQLALAGFAAGLVVLLVVLGWNRTLQRRVAARTTELKRELVERQTAEKALAESERSIRAVLDSVDAAVFLLDSSGLVRDCNAPALALSCRSETELLGAPIPPELLGASTAKQEAELLAAQSGDERQFECAALPRSGEAPLDLEVLMRPLALGGAPHVLVCVRDVTERKRLARMQGEFISTVSHELRTPVTAIFGSLRLLGFLSASMEGEAAEMLTVATRNAERLISLVDDILDTARLERGEVEFQLAPHRLSSLLDTAVEINQPYAAALDVRVERGECPADLSIAVDADRFAQLMANLISNASKFSPAGEAVEVSAARVENSVGARARVAVRDRGPGIPSEFRERIFQRFAQADSASTRATGGTGLGLAICRTIVERLGGAIGFDTAEGEGTTFWFELPVESAAPEASPSE